MNDRLWAKTAIRSCINSGISHFFVAPGSRCTPLTLAIAEEQNADAHLHFDERGLAFAALGYARATGRPAVFVCTSGTAVANAFPAVIEASMDHVPLVLFTADRPDELRGIGSNQTINQDQIFGNYPRHYVNFPVPEDFGTNQERDSQRWIAREIETGLKAARFGPVHFNWRFREPFTIDGNKQHNLDSLELVADAESHTGQAVHSDNQELPHCPKLELKGNVLIALGGCRPEEAVEAKKLARQMNCPLLSDITSGVREGSFELPSEFALPNPDTVIHLGDRITSKSWLAWTKQLGDEGSEFFHLSSTGQYINPAGLEQTDYHCSLVDISSRIQAESAESFKQSWAAAHQKRCEAISSCLDRSTALTEPWTAYCLSRSCPDSMGLFMGNSMPIRDFDRFGIHPFQDARQIGANRGASGIDGLVASSCGFATGTGSPVTVVIGDLSTLHDLNSLALVAESSIPMTVVVINNRGGHIFDLLPINRSPYFEKFFLTPHRFHFENAAEMFGLDYRQITTQEALRDDYMETIVTGKSALLEVIIDCDANLDVRRQLKEAIQLCNG